jgi:signal transduction histidine kinase
LKDVVFKNARVCSFVNCDCVKARKVVCEFECRDEKTLRNSLEKLGLPAITISYGTTELDAGFFKSILTAAQVGVLIIEADTHRVSYANPVAYQLIGSSVVGSICHNFLCPAEVGMCPVTDLGQTIDKSERLLINASGERIPVIKTVAITSLQKRKYIIEIFTNATERKQLEQHLQTERLAAIGQLAGMIGHDLRNPLQAMVGAVEILKMEVQTATAKDMIDLIEKSIDYSNKLISDLCDYSRAITLEQTYIDVRTILSEALSLMKVPDRIEVVDLIRNDLVANVDVSKMTRVFLNIIRNAIDAMPKGGKLTITGNESHDKIKITFTDTGGGMKREVLENMWKPLFTTKAKGMGLGLVICRRFVEAHGGSIRAESSVGKGSTITVELPIASSRLAWQPLEPLKCD